MTLEWKTEKRKLSELLPYEKNPRILTDKQRQDIEKSLSKFNLVEIPAINLDNKIIAGHQRIMILSKLKGPDFEIDVRVPNRLLDDTEYKEYLLRSNRNKAEWDWTLLEDNFDIDLLLESGFEAFEVDIDKMNINDAFSDMEQVKKKVKVSQCDFCKKSINIEVKYFIKDKTFNNYNFKDNNDESKLIYERLKDLIKDNRQLHIVIVENETINDEIISG